MMVAFPAWHIKHSVCVWFAIPLCTVCVCVPQVLNQIYEKWFTRRWPGGNQCSCANLSKFGMHFRLQLTLEFPFFRNSIYHHFQVIFCDDTITGRAYVFSSLSYAFESMNSKLHFTAFILSASFALQSFCLYCPRLDDKIPGKTIKCAVWYTLCIATQCATENSKVIVTTRRPQAQKRKITSVRADFTVELFFVAPGTKLRTLLFLCLPFFHAQ